MPKIDTSKIEGYAEMSAEDKVKALEAWEYDDNSAEVERWKLACNKACTDAATWKHKYQETQSDDAQKQATESELIAALRKELDTLRQEMTIREYIAEYVRIGYPDDLAQEAAIALVTGNSEGVFAIAQEVNRKQSNKARADALTKTPKPPAGSGERMLSVDDIRKMPFEERVAFAQKYPEQYKAAYDNEDIMKEM